MATQQPYWAGATPVDEGTLAAPPGTMPAANVPSGSPLAPGRAAPTGGRTPGVATPTFSLDAPKPADTFHTASQQEKIEKNLDANTDYKINDRTGEPTAMAKGEGALTPGDARRATTIGAQMEETERLYNQDIKGNPASRAYGALEYIDALPKNNRFTSAGNAMLPLIRPLIAQTAKEGDSDKEMTIFLSYIPKADDPDITIESKFRMLKTLIGGMSQGKSPEQLRAELGVKPGEIPKSFMASEDEAAAAATPGAGGGGPLASTPGQPAGPPSLAARTDPAGKVILNPTGGGQVQGGDTGLVGEEGGFHTEVNPKLVGANRTVNSMLKDRNTPISEITAYLAGKGAYPEAIADIETKAKEIRAWQRAEGKNYTGDYNVDIEDFEVENTASQDFQQSDVGAGLTGYVDAASMFNLDSAGALLGKDPEEIRTALEASAAAHPTSSMVGNIAGGVTTALAGEAAAGATGLGRVAAAGLGDVGYGFGAGVGGTDINPETGAPATVSERLMGGAKGAGAAAVGSAIGQTVAAPLTAAGRPSGNRYVRGVNEAEIPTTVGQQYGSPGQLDEAGQPVPKKGIGGIIKRTEDRIAGLAYIGDMIHARRMEGITKFNQKAFDRTLEPIGVKHSGQIGEDGIRFAEEKVGEAFEKALAGKTVTADMTFATKFTDAVQNVKDLKRVGPEVSQRVEQIIAPYKAGTTLDGHAMQQISRDLRDLKADYFKSNDTAARPIGMGIDKIEDAIFDMFRRQTPEVMPAYNAAKTAAKRLYILSDTVNAAKNKEGIFMPSQLGNADKANAIKMTGKVKAARGDQEFFKLQRDSQLTLPSTIPDSGTAGRILIPTLAIGGSGTTATGESTGILPAGSTAQALTVGTILAAAFTKGGQRLLTKPGRGAKTRAGRAASAGAGKALGHGVAVSAAQEQANK
jgi:hypothetical protein